MRVPKRENCKAVLPFCHPHVEPILAQRARLGSHTPSEDRQARLSGEGRGVSSPKAKFPLRLSLFVLAVKPILAQRARLGSHTPSEDRQARLSGEGRGYIRRRRNSRVNNRISDSNLFCPLRPHARPALPKGEPFRIKAYDFPDFNLPKQKTTSSDA